MKLNVDKFITRDPLEITRNNWIIGYIDRPDDDLLQEIHFCSDSSYSSGLLIDDIWGEPYVPISRGHKEDVYILVQGLDSLESYALEENFLFFCKFKHVNKTFLIWNMLENDAKEKIAKLTKGLKSKYDHDIDKTPRLSVITTVFNNAHLLEQTIQSVVNQDCSEFEYIIKDAMSSDNFDDIVRKYKEFNVRVIRQKDHGIYEGMDQGFRASNGEYVQILNSDDIFHDSHVISAYVEEIKKTASDAYCSDIMMFFENGKALLRRADLKQLRYKSCINHTSLALKYTEYLRLGGFDLNLQIAADCDLTIKLLKAGASIKHIPITCVNFRMGGASSGLSIIQLKESLLCRHRYSAWNIDGYLYTILSYLKSKIL